jgi:multicomponent Na+:H+ antiporter subunit G
VILIYFVFMTNPISSHALARAARRIGVPMAGRADEAPPSDPSTIRDRA